MRIRFLKLARTELREAIDYYNSQAPILGATFLSEVISSIERISRFPAAWQEVDIGVRSYRLGRFPYALIYVDEEPDLLVLSVAHLHRRPERWRDRLKYKR
jgi:hypothetical protein